MKTVSQAIRAASRAPKLPSTHSHWLSKVTPGKNSKTPRSTSCWRHNATTTAATGYTNAYDWLAKAMGESPGSMGTWAVQSGGTLTSTGITGLTSVPTSGLAGSFVVVLGDTNHNMAYGTILSSTATSVVVDQWVDATSTTGAAINPLPTGTLYMMILPGSVPACYMGVSGTNYVPSTSDQYLNTELVAGTGFSRAAGTYAHSTTTSTYTLVHLWTSLNTYTIYAEAQFNSPNVTNTQNAVWGCMPFTSAEPSPPTLVAGDTLQNTVTITM